MKHLYLIKKQVALTLVCLFSFQIFYIPTANALTGGPSQPESHGFQAAGTSDMVDLFTGDFSYNIPLFELPGPNGGYPFNLGYQSGIGMDQEASWVGLGWSLNPGAINRQMRGLPDEFNGNNDNGDDQVQSKMDIKSSVTVGLGAGAAVEIFGNDKISTSLGLSVRQNNYTGFGYSIDGSIGYQAAIGENASAGLGLGVSLDSQEGMNINPSLSSSGYILNASYNSREGLDNVGYTYTSGIRSYEDEETKEEKTFSSTSKSLANISLASPGFTPQVSMPMFNVNLSVEIKAGAAWWAIFGAPYVSGFYNQQFLKNRNKWVSSKAFGYMNYQNSTEEEDLLDFNRENDGVVTKESPNLSIPSLTYDIYSVTGQGMSAMYRPLRNDIGAISDPKAVSETAGGSAGVDVAPAASHTGVNLTINYGRSVSKAWTENNNAVDKLKFQQQKKNKDFEPWHFKAHGEATSDANNFVEEIGGYDAVRFRLNGSSDNIIVTSELETGDGWKNVVPDISSKFRERKSRSEAIQSFTNSELLLNATELVSYFKVKYLNANGNEVNFDRREFPDNHPAGFTALNAEGLRYNYGIPAYNEVSEEVMFSAKPLSSGQAFTNVDAGSSNDPKYAHDNTDKFLKRVKLPQYAHSYLLTSIIGPDYVDVTNNGVTDDDLGYWVKFTYQKTTDEYKWRDPYSKAHYSRGWETDDADNKGSFNYGEKELWFLRKAETKSHIAEFTLEDRRDAYGVASELQDTDNKGKATKALQSIQLYSKASNSGKPIKSVKFEYNYSLCQGVSNNIDGGGKLTLTKVWFEYGGLNKPAKYLTPYIFGYHPHNPNYDRNAYDRWGNFKPYPSGNPMYNKDYPYVEQDPAKKDEIDAYAASWSLTDITLPSGGKIKVDYESDDYGYVQHLQAMQMTKSLNPEGNANNSESGTTFSLDKNNLKVRFKLERPISEELTAFEKRQEVLKYIDSRTNQLFFKYKINLRKPSQAGYFEYIQGYVDIDRGRDNEMTLETNSAGAYAYGVFYVKAERGHNPFSMRAWQHLRANQPNLSREGREVKETDSDAERINQIKSLVGVFGKVREMFEGFYDYCNNNEWGKTVKAGEAYIRLKSPDKVKYGGGLRVRQITLKDSWTGDKEGIYGQVYEYTTEENGEIISSGVAAYEPLVGGEENPHRYAKKWVKSVKLKADNVLFFEYPINESYYPGPQVGYSKVRVTSLASAFKAGKEIQNIVLDDGDPLFPDGEGENYGTTGATEYEFYTSREFPVISDETEVNPKPYNLSVPIPLLGTVSVANLTASQGYSIITNDMHGRQKKISNFRQSADGIIEESPISYVQYNYLSKNKSYQSAKVRELHTQFVEASDNILKVASPADVSNSALTKFTLSQENEFFADMREYKDQTWLGGADINLDILYIPIIFAIIPVPAPMVWPSVSKSESLLRTAVTNKVIFKSGILESVEAYDGGSKVVTKNLGWDKLTGQAVLTEVNNNFDNPVYSYSIPAYTKYQGMGAAYQNIGFFFDVRNVQAYDENKKLYRFKNPSSKVFDMLHPGDEFILYTDEEGTEAAIKVYYDGEREGEKVFYSSTVPQQVDYTARIVRSGYRNQLNVMAGSVTALENPLEAGESVRFTKNIKVAK